MKILIITPHPDDEVLGCGGTIKKYTKTGNGVFACIVTKGYTPEWSKIFLNNKLEETKKSNKILGIKKTYYLNFPTVKLDSILQKDLNDAIQGIINKVRPEIIFIPHFGDLNKDHRLIHEAALVAARPLAGNSVKKILVYETISETEWGPLPFPFVPTVYYNINSTLKEKIKAMEAYGTELRPFPHPRSSKVIEALAVKRGSESGLGLAEAFMLIRSTGD